MIRVNADVVEPVSNGTDLLSILDHSWRSLDLTQWEGTMRWYMFKFGASRITMTNLLIHHPCDFGNGDWLFSSKPLRVITNL